MSKKRYAIVRVDTECPSHYENINNDFVCADVPKHYIEHCNNCRYGDTKEQLVNKITTAIEIAIDKYEKGKILLANKNKALAEIIVEFLGVK